MKMHHPLIAWPIPGICCHCDCGQAMIHSCNLASGQISQIKAVLAQLIAPSTVQMQFYLLCPLLMLCLRPAAEKGLERRLAKASGVIIAAVTAYRAVIALDFRLPVPVFGPLDDPDALDLMTRTLKVSPCCALTGPRLRHGVSLCSCSHCRTQGRHPCAMQQGWPFSVHVDASVHITAL